MERITEKNLQALCDRLNRLTNSPMVPYLKQPDGRYVAQIGNYHIDYAYGGAQLVRMYNDGGGVSTPLSIGHVPKRQCYELIHAYIRGIESCTP